MTFSYSIAVLEKKTVFFLYIYYKNYKVDTLGAPLKFYALIKFKFTVYQIRIYVYV